VVCNAISHQRRQGCIRTLTFPPGERPDDREGKSRKLLNSLSLYQPAMNANPLFTIDAHIPKLGVAGSSPRYISFQFTVER
jgi:hypothetical protein